MSFNSPILNLYSHISNQALNNPDKTALIGYNTEIIKDISFRDLKNNVDKIAGWILSSGIRQGEALGIAMPNCTEFLQISWASWSIGVITVPLDLKRDTIEDYSYKLNLANAKILITKGLSPEHKLKLKKFKILDIAKKGLANSHKVNWKSQIKHQALVLFTSGTTSKPKGAKLSLDNLVSNALAIKEWFKITSKDRFMVVLPLHHINSTSFCLATLLAGGSIAVPKAYSNSKFWQQLSQTKSTFTSIVPTICYDQISNTDSFKKYKKSLKVNRIQIGSAPVVVSDVKQFVKQFKIPLYQGYGQTETSLRVTGIPLDLDKKTYNAIISSNSIGIPLKWIEVVILDAEGNVLPENQEGELAVKGPNVMKGYLNNNSAFQKGYFLTGDLGYYKILKGKKYFFLKGRIKEIIIKGGVNISPVAVEDKLKQLSGYINQVFVIGVYDKRYGEEVAAVICWKRCNILKAKTQLKYMLSTNKKILADYETPRYIAALQNEKVPMTSTGKVQRSAIKSMKLRFEQIELINSTDYKFLRLKTKSGYFHKALKLYNYCWQPLFIDKETFSQHVRNSIVIIAIDKKDRVSGMISLIRTNLTEKQLSNITYDKLTSSQTLKSHDPQGRAVVCVSICSTNYKPQKEPQISSTPTKKEVMDYLKDDPVYKFHKKPKGSLYKGASLVNLIPKGRSEDLRSLGYNMLLKYPNLNNLKIKIDNKASVAVQLIEVSMILAQFLDVSNFYAYSRPIGLAAYASNHAVLHN